MRWAILFKVCHTTRTWTQLPFYGKWCWAKYSTYTSKTQAEAFMREYHQRQYPSVEFCIFPTNLLRAPGRR